jgi:hypothetical protein
MILFSWKKVLRESGYSTRELLKIMSYITFKPEIYSINDINFRYATKDWSGDCFLLNPKPLFVYRKRFRDKHIVEYIRLASQRSYAEYLSFGTVTLDFLALPEKEDLINNNSLLKLHNDLVYFRFEKP